jgi:hypothetical protein
VPRGHVHNQALQLSTGYALKLVGNDLVVTTGYKAGPYVPDEINKAVMRLLLLGQLDRTVQKLRVFPRGFLREKFDG